MQHDAHVWAFRCQCWLEWIWVQRMFRSGLCLDIRTT